MNVPKVAVVVPNYNHGRFLRKRIDTILAQTCQDFELILLDDCSTDESREIIHEYASHPRVTHVEFNETNSGSTFKQWNKGVRLARGEHIWIAESDDYSDPQFLERLVTVLDRDSNIVWVFCRSHRVMEHDDHLDGFVDFRPVSLKLNWTSDFCMAGRRMCEECFALDNVVPNASSLLFRRAVYEKIGGADERLRTCGDWKMWAAMALSGSVAYVSEPLNYYRYRHAASVRNAIWGPQPSLGARHVQERFLVSGWILDQIRASRVIVQRARRQHSRHWIPILLAARAPIETKRAALAAVRKLDPHPARTFLWAMPSVASLAVAQARSKAPWVARNYLWHPILNATRPFRHLLGLNIGNLRRLLGRTQQQHDRGR